MTQPAPQTPTPPRWDADRRRMEGVGVRLPDSTTAQGAWDLIGQHADSMIYAHSVRTFLFASLFGRIEQATWDEEALYVACILHDIGLTPAFDDPEKDFEHVSAETAVALTERFGWPRPRRDKVNRSIVMHMAREISASESVETRLLAAGVSCDVSGARVTEIDHMAMTTILEHFPRRQFKPAFAQLLQSEAKRKPRSAAAVLIAAGLLARIDDAPFQDSE